VSHNLSGKFSFCDLPAIVVLVAVKVYLLARFGIYPWQDNDGWGYVTLAEQMIDGAVWKSVPDLSRPLPLSLLRVPGYPIFVAAAKVIGGPHWIAVIIALQLLVSTVASYVLYRVASVLSRSRIIGLICAFIFATSVQGVFDRYVLTDSPYTSLFTIVVCYAVWLVHTVQPPTAAGIAFISASLAILFLLRESTLVLAVALVPLLVLSFSSRPNPLASSRLLVLAFAPMIVAALAVASWNMARVGQPIITAGTAYGFPVALMRAEIAAERPFLHDAIFYRIWPLKTELSRIEAANGKIFTRDSLVDEMAHKHIKTFNFHDFDAIIKELREDRGLSFPEISALMMSRYANAWWDRPDLMLKYLVSGFELMRYVLHSPFVVQFFRLSEGPVEVWRQPYVAYFGYLFDLSLTALPLCWLALAVFARAARRYFYLIGACIFFAWVMILGYAAISVEERYILPTIAPLLLALAATVGAAIDLARWLIFRRRMFCACGIARCQGSTVAGRLQGGYLKG
jgi:hypothetical protein